MPNKNLNVQAMLFPIFRYRMATSGGGGYCDCGDEEAFHAHAMCDKHKEAAAKSKTDGPHFSPDVESLKRFPSDVRERAEFLFSDICKYCMLVMSERYDAPNSICEL